MALGSTSRCTSTGDRLYVSSDLDTASYVWPERTLEKVRRGEARSFAPHPDGQLVARGMKATVELYGEFKKKRVATCKNTAADGVPSMVWVDGNLVCAALGKGLAKVYDHAGAKLTALKRPRAGTCGPWHRTGPTSR